MLRAQKKENTRQALVEAAWALFRAKGYDATTIEEIADAANVAKRTYFRYFPTKEAIVFHRAAERLVLLESLLSAGPRGMPTVRKALLEIARHFAQDRDEVLEQYRLVESTPSLAMTEGEIDRKWIAAIGAALTTDRTAAGQRRARVLAGALFGAMRATLGEWVAHGGRADLVRLGLEALELFDRAAA
jgi:AcrR family transcriptional regulator